MRRPTSRGIVRAIARPAGIAIALCLSILAARSVPVTENDRLPRADGYRGIWYSNQPSDDEYRYKYSGGLGTYCAKHLPLAYYSPEARKTFFVYGGTKGLGEDRPLLEMVSYYDHDTGLVPKPTIVLEKNTSDAHHNPTISVDPDGYLWIFMSSHGGKDGFIYRSRAPYSIDAFDRIEQHEFTYPQPHRMPGDGFLFLFTKYTAGRELYWRVSSDGATWSDDHKLAGFGGHYQVSWAHGDKCGTAFNYHPPVGGLNARTNLYYLETADYGQTWRNAAGDLLEVPLDAVDNPALVHDYQSAKLLVYMKDVNFDAAGRPVILYLVSNGYESGPVNDPRFYTTARWTGSEWVIRPAFPTDHNYDTGCLHIEDDGTWRIIAPTEPGPQPYCTGGDVAMWTSRDQGKTWEKVRVLTHDSPRNHTYVRRPVNAHPDFYAFWADGNALEPSESRLYFANKAGDVFILPETMTEDFAEPLRLHHDR
ncbi:MAG: BNR-4 repeat-containing protein [Armatimonadota bacterium]|nr:MAG: BNR-4 repeat-containing protein [Armatimonadota bacterium]